MSLLFFLFIQTEEQLLQCVRGHGVREESRDIKRFRLCIKLNVGCAYLLIFGIQ